MQVTAASTRTIEQSVALSLFYLDVFQRRSLRHPDTPNFHGPSSCSTCLYFVLIYSCRFAMVTVPERAVGGCGLSCFDLEYAVKQKKESYTKNRRSYEKI